MKVITIRIDDDMHKALKIHAVLEGTSIQEIVIKHLKQELEEK